MAGASLLTLLDDIATVLDDVAILSKVAGKKVAGVLGDDLALNAEQVAGVRAERELPVIWAVAKGSVINKVILVPAALAISALVPWLVTPLLMLGGLFLCFEGFEKVAHKLLHDSREDEAHREEIAKALIDPKADLRELEKDKIRGAIRTDFILSAEVIVITLGIVAGASLLTQVSVLVMIAALMTIVVYGLVAGIVKLDDLGLYLSKSAASTRRRIGRGLLRIAPYLMKALSIVGTAAMFLVGGGILAHGLPGLESWLHHLTDEMNGGASVIVSTLLNALLGIVAGGIAVGLFTLFRRLFGGSAEPAH